MDCNQGFFCLHWEPSQVYLKNLIKMWAADSWAKAEEWKEVVWWGFCGIEGQGCCSQTDLVFFSGGESLYLSTPASHSRRFTIPFALHTEWSRTSEAETPSTWPPLDWGPFLVSSFLTLCVIKPFEVILSQNKQKFHKMMSPWAYLVMFILPISRQKSIQPMLTIIVVVQSLSHIWLFATPWTASGFPVLHCLLEFSQTYVHCQC